MATTLTLKERFEAVVLGCFGSALFWVVYTMGAGVMAWYSAHSASVQGIPAYKAIPLGVGVFLGLVLAAYLFVAFIERYRKPRSGQRPAPANQPLETVAAECPDRWLHDIAANDKRRVEQLVFVESCEPKKFNLERDDAPFIEWWITVFNASVYTVHVQDGVTGRITYRESEYPLSGDLRILENDAKTLEHTQREVFKLRQWINQTECDLIRKLTKEHPEQPYYTEVDLRRVQIGFTVEFSDGSTQNFRLKLPVKSRLPLTDLAAQVETLKAQVDYLLKSGKQSAVELEGFKWLHEIAEYDKYHIDASVRLVWCLVGMEQAKLDSPYVQFQFTIFNGSVYPITFKIEGFVMFGSRRLSGDITTLPAANNATVNHANLINLEFRVWLNKEEATYVYERKDIDSFFMDELILMIQGGEGFKDISPKRLRLPNSIDTRGGLHFNAL
jgi:hypothetical protein